MGAIRLEQAVVSGSGTGRDLNEMTWRFRLPRRHT